MVSPGKSYDSIPFLSPYSENILGNQITELNKTWIHLYEITIIISFENQSVLLHHIVGMIQYIYIVSYRTKQYCTYDMIQFYIIIYQGAKNQEKSL